MSGVYTKISKEFFRTTLVVLIVLSFTWGITKATENELESATKNFSVIGTLSSISDETISLIDARGSDTKEEELYNLDIKYLKGVETKEYQPLVVSDLKPGDTIIAQGVTNGTKFFITRIISFSTTPLPLLDNFATSTVESVATSTTDTIASSTPSEEYFSTSTQENVNAGDESQNSTSTVVDTISGIIEEGLDNASDVLDSVLDTITEPQEVETNLIEENLPDQNNTSPVEEANADSSSEVPPVE